MSDTTYIRYTCECRRCGERWNVKLSSLWAPDGRHYEIGPRHPIIWPRCHSIPLSVRVLQDGEKRIIFDD